MSIQSYFITTAIPYVNSKPHIGHAQEFILTDALARYYRQQGHQVVLQSGTDDNATKNVFAAAAAGISTADFVNSNAGKFSELLSLLGVPVNIFVRTSSEKHHLAVQSFLQGLDKDDIYESVYSGLYCTGCEDFVSDGDLVNGICPDHQKKPDQIEEKNFFFRLSRYQEKIRDLIQSDGIKITPSWRKKEILSFIDQGLQDISLSRSSLRTLGWGVKYPGCEDQTVYVWIDALINYISGDAALWHEDVYKVHVVGKNVWKFHAIYWPALLLSAGLVLPNEIFIHGFLTSKGTKISKSVGNSIDPIEVIGRYGLDAFRYYLLGSLSFLDDADFVEDNLVAAFNADLANKVGNLTARVLALRKGLEIETSKIETGVPFVQLKERAVGIANELNHEISSLKPWEWTADQKSERLSPHLGKWSQGLQQISFLLKPIIPEGATRIADLVDGKINSRQAFPRIKPRAG